ncbi:MAG: type VI secretion system tip protein VgrG [candidate division Zixibacteria bacterium]|nr:type VI secretion system tip protein VgrG [candidate division Zixibacteria bacterium]
MAILRRGSEADFLFESKGYTGDLRVVAFTGREELSHLFFFQLELASDDAEIDLNAVVGQPASLTIKSAEGECVIHGLVSRMEEGGKGEKFSPYKALLVPEVWLLTRRVQSRIFQKKTVQDIAKEVLEAAGVPSSRFRFALKRSLPAREYCVQYRESDWSFVSRLLEEDGIFYFFEQKDKETVLVMGDSPDAVVAIEAPEKIPYREPATMAPGKEAVYEFRFAQELKSGKAALKDYNFTRPDVLIEGEAKAARDDKLEIYDYPGYYVVSETGGASDAEKFKSGDLTALGKDLAQIRLDEEQATRRRAEGASLCRRFLPGFFFELADHSRFSGKYLLVSVTHSASQPAVPSAGAPKITYENRFACIPKEVVFRPARLTPKPVVKGVQNAWVTGPKGEEIYTDSYGRVKVQFPWDRQGKKDDKSSSWVRVSSLWAGKGWGGIYIPRIGQEVLVDFLEGDPDRPIIVGRVYNGANLPPYKLPDEKTKSTLKSSSSKGGDGFNEIRFEDNKGKEQIFIHAEKDIDIRIKTDRREWVGRNRHLIVKQDKFEHVENKRHETVDSDHLEKIKGDRNLAVAGKEAIEVGGSHSFTVKGDVIEVFKANHSEKTSNDYYLKADNIVIEADTNVTIKVGGSHIAIEAGGIKIGTSGQLKIESTGPLKVESKATADLEATKTSVNGKAMVQIQGGIVKIN